MTWPVSTQTSGVRTPWSGYEGRIDIEHLDLRWPPLDLSASGSIGLDEERRPSGRLETWWRDLPGLMEGLVAAGLVDARALTPLKAAMALLPRRAGIGRASENNPSRYVGFKRLRRHADEHREQASA